MKNNQVSKNAILSVKKKVYRIDIDKSKNEIRFSIGPNRKSLLNELSTDTKGKIAGGVGIAGLIGAAVALASGPVGWAILSALIGVGGLAGMDILTGGQADDEKNANLKAATESKLQELGAGDAARDFSVSPNDTSEDKELKQKNVEAANKIAASSYSKEEKDELIKEAVQENSSVLANKLWNWFIKYFNKNIMSGKEFSDIGSKEELLFVLGYLKLAHQTFGNFSADGSASSDAKAQTLKFYIRKFLELKTKGNYPDNLKNTSQAAATGSKDEVLEAFKTNVQGLYKKGFENAKAKITGGAKLFAGLDIQDSDIPQIKDETLALLGEKDGDKEFVEKLKTAFITSIGNKVFKGLNKPEEINRIKANNSFDQENPIKKFAKDFNGTKIDVPGLQNAIKEYLTKGFDVWFKDIVNTKSLKDDLAAKFGMVETRKLKDALILFLNEAPIRADQSKSWQQRDISLDDKPEEEGALDLLSEKEDPTPTISPGASPTPPPAPPPAPSGSNQPDPNFGNDPDDSDEDPPPASASSPMSQDKIGDIYQQLIKAFKQTLLFLSSKGIKAPAIDTSTLRTDLLNLSKETVMFERTKFLPLYKSETPKYANWTKNGLFVGKLDAEFDTIDAANKELMGKYNITSTTDENEIAEKRTRAMSSATTPEEKAKVDKEFKDLIRHRGSASFKLNESNPYKALGFADKDSFLKEAISGQADPVTFGRENPEKAIEMVRNLLETKANAIMQQYNTKKDNPDQVVRATAAVSQIMKEFMEDIRADDKFKSTLIDFEALINKPDLRKNIANRIGIPEEDIDLPVVLWKKDTLDKVFRNLGDVLKNDKQVADLTKQYKDILAKTKEYNDLIARIEKLVPGVGTAIRAKAKESSGMNLPLFINKIIKIIKDEILSDKHLDSVLKRNRRTSEFAGYIAGTIVNWVAKQMADDPSQHTDYQWVQNLKKIKDEFDQGNANRESLVGLRDNVVEVVKNLLELYYRKPTTRPAPQGGTAVAPTNNPNQNDPAASDANPTTDPNAPPAANQSAQPPAEPAATGEDIDMKDIDENPPPVQDETNPFGGTDPLVNPIDKSYMTWARWTNKNCNNQTVDPLGSTVNDLQKFADTKNKGMKIFLYPGGINLIGIFDKDNPSNLYVYVPEGSIANNDLTKIFFVNARDEDGAILPPGAGAGGVVYSTILPSKFNGKITTETLISKGTVGANKDTNESTLRLQVKKLLMEFIKGE